MNDVIVAGARQGLGLGEALGRAILDGDFPHKDVSVLAAGVRFGVPVTVHVGIGYDILHEHPNCDGAALGAASYRDFLTFAAEHKLAVTVHPYPLDAADQAQRDLKAGRFDGAAVLVP